MLILSFIAIVLSAKAEGAVRINNGLDLAVVSFKREIVGFDFDLESTIAKRDGKPVHHWHEFLQ